MSKLLVVFGATGNQGGSVVDYVSKDPELSKEYRLRAVTRDPSSASSQALEKTGAEVVKGDLEDEKSIKAALEGAHAVFLVTTSIYDDKLEEREIRVGHSVADLAVAAGVELFIYSSLTHARDQSNGNIKNLGSFDAKAEVERYIRTLPMKCAFFAPGSFMQNFNVGMGPQPLGDGTFAIFNFIKPETQFPVIDIAADTGKWVGAVLADPNTYHKTFFAAATTLHTWIETAEIMSKVSGKTIVYKQLPKDTYLSNFPPGMRPYFGDMFEWMQDYGYYGPGTQEQVEWAASKARGKLTTLEEYLEKSPMKL